MTTAPLFLDSTLPAPAAGPRVARDEMTHLAHELNNLLAIIIGHADALDVTLPESFLDRSSVAAIRSAAEAAADVAARVRAAGRSAHDATPVATRVDSVLRAAGTELAARFPDRLAVTVHAAPHLWTASVDATLLDDTIMAVVGQAAAALPHGAAVRIRLTNAELGASRPHLVGSVRRARFVRVEIAIPEAASRLALTAPGGASAPATTADVCFAALAAAGARVSIDSDATCASLVCLLLPSDGIERRATSDAGHTSVAPRPLRRTIAVLDGDGARRALLHKILRAQGFLVLPAASEAEIAAVVSTPDVDLLIADRPVEWLETEARSGLLPVLYTGRTALPEGTFGPSASVRALPTPFGAAQLVSAVQGVFGPAASSAGAALPPMPFKGGAVQPNLMDEPA